MSKKLNKDSMSALIGGLVGPPVVPKPDIQEESEKEQIESPVSPSPTSKEVTTPRRGRPSGVKKEAVCYQLDVDLISKVRAIAKKEDWPITSIIEAGIRKIVKEYEDKNGPVRVRQAKKKNIDDVFSL